MPRGGPFEHQHLWDSQVQNTMQSLEQSCYGCKGLPGAGLMDVTMPYTWALQQYRKLFKEGCKVVRMPPIT